MINICYKDSILPLSPSEKRLFHHIKTKTYDSNMDNISRTNAYLHFYYMHPNIRWSFLAHMVSRNAGWNMCDLEGKWFPRIINQEKREQFFLTFERANWLIFQDAFPQLLLYHYSTKMGQPMFHLLSYFHVSSFMKREWERFWFTKDRTRLLISLIINEQNVIQKPVINHPLYKRKVFNSALFLFQDWLHFSSVLFPTIHGELFGASVNGFRSLNKRIDLGKRLANILFQQELYPEFFKFARKTVHTGSGYDYEQYFRLGKGRSTPLLRTTYPVVEHHIHTLQDWSKRKSIHPKWFSSKVKHRHPIHLTTWYREKQKQLQAGILLKEMLSP